MFVNWAQQHVQLPSQLGCPSWDDCHYDRSLVFPNASQLTKTGAAAHWYYSQKFTHDQGIEQFKAMTDALTASIPNAKVGANQVSFGTLQHN